MLERAATSPPPRSFAAAWDGSRPGRDRRDQRRSPSRGDLQPGLDAAVLARAYAAGGASCLSVLTDEPHFGGSPDDLAARPGGGGAPGAAQGLHRGPYHVVDARMMGADAVLLIVAALDARTLHELHTLAAEFGLTVLVEVHDGRGRSGPRRRAGSASSASTSVISSRSRSSRPGGVMAADLPEGAILVAESGIRGPMTPVRSRSGGLPRGAGGCSRWSRPPIPPGLAGKLLAAETDSATGAAGSVVAVFVKICGVSSEEDALLSVAMGADAVGFIFAPSPRAASCRPVCARSCLASRPRP